MKWNERKAEKYGGHGGGLGLGGERKSKKIEGGNSEGENRWRRFLKFTKGASREAKLWTRNGEECYNKAIWDDGSYKRLRRRNFKLLHQFRVKRTWETKRKYQRSCGGFKRCRNRLIKDNWRKSRER